MYFNLKNNLHNLHRKMMKRKPWRKNLYENQEYPDNYTDESFLKELRVNIYFKPVSLYDSALGASLLVQELCTIITFFVIYVYLYNDWIDPNYMLYMTSTATACGFALYRTYFNEEKVKSPLGHDFRTIIIFVVFGQLFAPVLHTLTDTISTDTIYTTAFLMMLVRLVFFDYGVPATVVSNSLSLSAAVFASICLSSRLSSPYQASILMTISVQCFVLFPLLKSKMQYYPALTIVLVIFVLSILLTVSLLMTVFFLLSVILLNVICPLLYTRYQKYKDNIYGPWDEAIVHGLDRNNE